MMICPSCNGEKSFLVVHVRPVPGATPGIQPGQTMPCFDCNGSGEIPDERRPWIEAGAKVQDWRLNIARRGLREEAEHRGILPSVYCDMEHGRIEPVVSSEMVT